MALLLAALPATACCKPFDPATQSEDALARAWIHDWTGKTDWIEITAWQSVSSAGMPEAEELLHDSAVVQLSEERALNFVGHPNLNLRESSGTTFLLRAVGDSENRWPLEVFVDPKEEIWIGGGANSRCPVPMRRRAVVARLVRQPARVYVTFVVGK
ncbi:MAG TPA: hypothetical protein VKT53_17010 [Candidatus Acidoferrum sp.]|nr:hypothetical protein [Candidatus Acidoferrum sp.]